MLVRIVRLTFKEEEVATFLQIFEESKDLIRNFKGCNELNLLQQKDQPNIFSTLSIWENEEALENYRHSDLFKSTWTKTKVLFDAKPAAWSFDKLHHLP